MSRRCTSIDVKLEVILFCHVYNNALLRTKLDGTCTLARSMSRPTCTGIRSSSRTFSRRRTSRPRRMCICHVHVVDLVVGASTIASGSRSMYTCSRCTGNTAVACQQPHGMPRGAGNDPWDFWMDGM